MHFLLESLVLLYLVLVELVPRILEFTLLLPDLVPGVGLRDPGGISIPFLLYYLLARHLFAGSELLIIFLEAEDDLLDVGHHVLEFYVFFVHYFLLLFETAT